MFEINIGDVIRIKNRIETINEHLQSSGTASIKELGTMFPDVSEMTIRRDLALLEDRGEIVRTRGGAKSIRSLLNAKEETYTARTVANPAGKKIIAQKALSCLGREHSVFIDAGTTGMALAKALPDAPLHVVTNAPNIGLEALKNEQATVLLPGGKISRDNVCIAGSAALQFFENVNIDLAFMVASGFSDEGGFTSGNLDECALKRLVVQKAGRVIMLMDVSKLGKTLPYTFARLEDVDILISDQRLPKGIRDTAKQYNIKLM